VQQWAPGGQKVGHLKPQGVSHEKTAPELAGWLASLQLDEKSASDTGCQRKFILAHI
jgi:hypothetical protein